MPVTARRVQQERPDAVRCGVARNTYLPETEVLKALLREIRVRAELRQVDLANLIGHGQPFISEYEAG
jgi:hypothetical protein